MGTITAQAFWQHYRNHLCRLGDWESYQSSKKWTKIATQAAVESCTSLGLQVDREYLRIDVCGWDTLHPNDSYDWTMRVAFEVENNALWKDELCKLAHIVSNLCVLSAYEWHATWTAKEALDEYLHKMRDRVSKVPGRQWLFIFGPHGDKLFDPWQAFTFDRNYDLIPVEGVAPLRGCDLEGPIKRSSD